MRKRQKGSQGVVMLWKPERESETLRRVQPKDRTLLGRNDTADL